MKIQKPTIRFGPESGNNIYFECDIVMGVHLFGDRNMIVYDKMRLQTEFNVEISREVFFANFVNMFVIPIGEARTKPIFTTLEFTPEDYDDVWDFISLKTRKWLDYLNTEVLQDGIPLPYWKLSILFALTFHPGAVIVVGNLFYND
jgi:hypothetical protein